MICRICDSLNLHPVIDLGEQPNAGEFLTREQCGHEKKYPLKVLFCEDCHAAQLDTTVPKETLFRNHTYLSGTTRTLTEHFMQTARYVDAMFFGTRHGKSVLDIGSNDGTQLRCYKALGYKALGVEACNSIARIANQNGILTLNKFFNLETAEFIGGKFDVINASGVFFHLEELHSVCEGIKLLLADDGVFVVQFIYAKSMMDNGAFDQIYHEHLLYYTLETIQVLLDRHALHMFDAYLSPIHGGSIIGFVKHWPHKLAGKSWNQSDRLMELLEAEEKPEYNSKEGWLAFGKRIETMKAENLAKLHEWKSQGKRVYGMGAAVKTNTLLNTFQIGPDLIECLVEKNESRRGLYAPGSHIPILMESEVEPPDCYLVGAWNFRKEILANNRHLIEKGVEFFFPVNVA